MRRTKEQIAQIIEEFLDAKGSSWDWDDFISIRIDDPELDGVRRLCSDLPNLYPPNRESSYCSEKGLAILDEVRDTFRKNNR
jgi:hypothetical protein